ncbi:hypothetical protein MTR67_001934 [Solanum verrucosum]|uniref:Tf2-1-like SH3-like domain-containing protein n=1 Tax=Solanum verrucosum TaxID=315347 RepID=A0AAF0PP48_SOLVR|nr:hypothetical protein MTR67_001934 [Solanum verrucosum]
MKGVMRFGKKGKLSPPYIGPYRMTNRLGNVAYELELPLELATVHPVFHLSMLKKCLDGSSLIMPTENIVAAFEAAQDGSTSRATSQPVVKTTTHGKAREDAFNFWRPRRGGLATGSRTMGSGEDHGSWSLP